MIHISEPSFDKKEENLIIKIIKSKRLVDGYFQQKAEKTIKKILDVKYIALTQSCSDALEVAAILINLKPGDEVLMPSYTFSSTANAVVLRGSKPVFVDINYDDLNINLDDLEKKITKKTKAIFVVHYAGISCDMDRLIQIKKKYKLLLVEDAAHAFLSRYRNKFLGKFGEISAFSFHATKNFAAGQCGAIVINKKKFINRAQILLDKGTNRKKIISYKNNFLINQKKKRLSYSWHDIGSEYRASEMSSAMLYAQILKRKKIQGVRKKIWNFYYNFLKNLNNNSYYLLNVNSKIQQSFHLFPIIFKDRFIAEKFIKFMQTNGISATFHYIPLHNSFFGKKILKNKQNLIVTENIYKRIVRIPIHANLKNKQLNLIKKCIKKFFESIN